VDFFTNRKAVAQVRELIGDPTGRISDDTGWSSSLILDRLYKTRSEVLKNKMRANETINPQNIQQHPCVKLVKADKHECPCAPPTGCVWMKTFIAMPPFLSMLSVTSIDGSIKYDYVPWNRTRHVLESMLPQERNLPYYTQKTVKDGIYFYLVNDKHKKYITPIGIWSDPRQVQLAPDCKGNYPKCPRILDLQFVIDPDVEELVFSTVTERLKIGRSGVPAESINDDRADFTRPVLK